MNIDSTKPTILIVEDESNVREALEITLKRKYTLILCSTGNEGIAKANDSVSVVILDIKMEGLNGFETFIEIKKKYPLVPIIFHSAYQDLKNPYEIMNDYRPFGYVIKEGDGKELRHTVESAIDYSRQINQNTILVQQLQQQNNVLQELKNNLEVIVATRTEELTVTNKELQKEIIIRQNAEEALKESEGIIRKKLDYILSPSNDLGNIELSDIIDFQVFQSLMDDFFAITKIGIGITDIHGKLLITTGWQDICLKFHRIHPVTCQNCLESDTILSKNVAKGEFKLYRCKNNLWDIVTPIIVGDKHFGNIFLGQFIFEEEKLDKTFFRNQANLYNFDEEEYISALEKIPVWSKSTINSVMNFYTKLSDLIAKLSYSNISLARSITKSQQAEEKIKSLLNEKDIILKEVHHRIKNNMTTLKSLLSLQAVSLKEPSAIEALLDAGNRIQSMMLLYDKLYQSDNFDEMSIKDYLVSLVDHIISNFSISNKIRTEKKIADFIFEAKGLQSLGIIVNELITNIMKYAFIGKESGIIKVEVGLRPPPNDNRAFLIIEDNGKGLPETVDFNNSSGFGFRLIEILAKQLRGNLQIERENGTRIIMDFERIIY